MLLGSKQVVGLDIGSSAVKIAELKPLRNNSYRVTSIGIESLPPQTIVDGAIIDRLPVSDAITKIFEEQKIKNKRVATSISGHSVIIKKITVPIHGEEDLDEVIRYEAQQYIPFELADVNLDFEVLDESPNDEGLSVLLVAAKKDKIADHTGAIAFAGKIPTIVDVDVFALQNAYEVNYQPTPQTITALLDIGASLMNINILRGRESLFARDITMGGNQYTESLQSEFNLSFDEAEKLKKGAKLPGISEEAVARIISSVSELVALEIEKTIDFFKTTTSAKLDRMIVSGGSSHVPGLIEFLSKKFEVPAERFDSFKRISYDPKRFDPGMMARISPDIAIAVGLALRKLED